VLVRPAWQAAWRGAAGALRGASLTEGYFADERLTQTVHHWSRKTPFDVVFVYSSGLAAAGLRARARRRVLDLCDVDSFKWALYARRSPSPLRGAYGLEARRVAALEARACPRYDLCLVVNERERRKLRRRAPGLAAQVLPTTIDMSALRGEMLAALPSEPVVGMVGSMFYPPNVRGVNWFGAHVWPRVKAAVPGARWLIVGARPAASVRRWARDPQVVVTGYVEDVRPYLAAMRVFVNPVDGDIGVQSKLLMAMGAGRACVVSPTSAAGVEHDDPPPFAIAGSPDLFAEAAVRLLRDDAAARALAARARNEAQRRYDLTACAALLESWLTPPADLHGRVVSSESVPIQAARCEFAEAPR
jgi:glycosyltransferase involved in cell wall biosynthesis